MRNTWMGDRRQQSEIFTLARDATLRPGRGVIRVERGVVIATQPGDPEDHVLLGGMEFRPASRKGVVLWALEEAVVTVGPAAAPDRATAPAEPAACPA